MYCLCVGIVEHFFGIFILIIHCWNNLALAIAEQITLLKKPCYNVWEKYRCLSCAAIGGGGGDLPFIFHNCAHHRELTSRGMYQYSDQLRTLLLISHPKTMMWSKISPLFFSWQNLSHNVFSNCFGKSSEKNEKHTHRGLFREFIIDIR